MSLLYRGSFRMLRRCALLTYPHEFAWPCLKPPASRGGTLPSYQLTPHFSFFCPLKFFDSSLRAPLLAVVVVAALVVLARISTTRSTSIQTSCCSNILITVIIIDATFPVHTVHHQMDDATSGPMPTNHQSTCTSWYQCHLCPQKSKSFFYAETTLTCHVGITGLIPGLHNTTWP